MFLGLVRLRVGQPFRMQTWLNLPVLYGTDRILLSPRNQALIHCSSTTACVHSIRGAYASKAKRELEDMRYKCASDLESLWEAMIQPCGKPPLKADDMEDVRASIFEKESTQFGFSLSGARGFGFTAIGIGRVDNFRTNHMKTAETSLRSDPPLPFIVSLRLNFEFKLLKKDTTTAAS